MLLVLVLVLVLVLLVDTLMLVGVLDGGRVGGVGGVGGEGGGVVWAGGAGKVVVRQPPGCQRFLLGAPTL